MDTKDTITLSGFDEEYMNQVKNALYGIFRNFPHITIHETVEGQPHYGYELVGDRQTIESITVALWSMPSDQWEENCLYYSEYESVDEYWYEKITICCKDLEGQEWRIDFSPLDGEGYYFDVTTIDSSGETQMFNPYGCYGWGDTQSDVIKEAKKWCGDNALEIIGIDDGREFYKVSRRSKLCSLKL